MPRGRLGRASLQPSNATTDPADQATAPSTPCQVVCADPCADMHRVCPATAENARLHRRMTDTPGRGQDGTEREDTPCRLGPGDAVWARNFRDGEKWLPGTIKQLNGARIMTIQTSAGLLERHMDQFRLRDSLAPVLRRSTRVKKPVQRYPP
ncbi:hypothetical protein HPB50_013431 [Hyalomma asiaticum]|uniref:Uncharacterized protein n=1 Tax=Hyalomma asiaticum TaxID=266040 RepID=A0ACB7SQ08_HYAAI|nr:hypothetical protein HPB50_013431 [Hyalomma asiaticum]